MAADIVPLKGAIANLNWFDAQRKHYETPDQIARRFRLPDDAGMRAFCQGAASVSDRHTVQFVRRLPLTAAGAWSYLAEPDKVEEWLPGARWSLESGGEYRLPLAGTEGEIAEAEPHRRLKLQASTGAGTEFQLHDATGSARARRDIPNYQGPITELHLTDTLADDAEVPKPLQDTSAEHVAQPGGIGTHWVSQVADWHHAATLLQKLAFASGNAYWPPELAVGLDDTALIAAYAKLLAAYHKG